MVKMVLSDYWGSRKESYHRMSKQMNNWMIFFNPLIMPIQMLVIWEDVNLWIIYGELFPMILGAIQAVMYPARLSKVMYLCPMGLKDRQRYIRTAYRVRVAVIMGLWLVLNLLMLPFGGLPLLELLLGGGRMLCYALAVNVYLAADKNHEEYASLKIGRCNICWMFAFYIGMIGAIVQGACVGGELYVSLGEGIVMGIFVLAQLLIAAIAVLKYKGKVMHYAMDYELIQTWQEEKLDEDNH